MASVPIDIDYDKIADVLYVSLGEPDRRAHSSEGPEGVIWRTSPEGIRQGVTIRNFHLWWEERRAELVDLISNELDVSKSELDRELPELVA